jgi:fermentation-respiration switch protein FrsA (DUF1100 family)
MTTALIVLRVAIAVYLGLIAVLWLVQERIVFQPPANPEPADSATTRLDYTSSDGIRLFAYVVEPAQPGGPVIIAFHGNAMISRWMIPWAREVSRRLQATVVLPEYRGYDGLAGKPSYSGAGLDAAAALAATSDRFHLKPGDVFYYGHSLGSAVATELASAAPPRALLLEAPFTSARDMAGRMPVIGLRWFWRSISRVHYETVDRVAKIDVPVHVVHGERDVIIPVRMGRDVHDAAGRKGSLLIIPEADHNDVPIAGGDAYWRWFAEALRPGAH